AGAEGDHRARDRVPAIQAALASGFAKAAREWVYREQEVIRRAALDARDRAEAAERASEARFRAMFTDAAVGIGICDAGGRILEANAALAAMLGFGPDEMRGADIADLFDGTNPPELSHLFRETAAGRRDHYRV